MVSRCVDYERYFKRFFVRSIASTAILVDLSMARGFSTVLHTFHYTPNRQTPQYPRRDCLPPFDRRRLIPHSSHPLVRPYTSAIQFHQANTHAYLILDLPAISNVPLIETLIYRSIRSFRKRECIFPFFCKFLQALNIIYIYINICTCF